MTRMTLTTCEISGTVTLTYTDWEGDARVRRFSTMRPHGNSYVIELLPDGSTKQPCERLDRIGSTLMSTREGLADTIRAEYRAMRRAERRDGLHALPVRRDVSADVGWDAAADAVKGA